MVLLAINSAGSEQTKTQRVEGRMKRSLLFFAVAGVFGIGLLGSGSAAGQTRPSCGTQLDGNYAIKIIGARSDTGTPATGDPQPIPIAAVGVFHADGHCNITGGELIENDGGNFTGPTVTSGPASSGITVFSGSSSPNLTGSYFFNSDNAGILTLTDSSKGSLGTVTFAIAIERGNAEFRGPRLNAGDPVSILGEKQAPVTTAQFITSSSFLCDGSGLPSSILGLGYEALGGTMDANLDPETGTTIEAGGSLLYNSNNGYLQGPIIGNMGQRPGGGAFQCDFEETLLSPPSIVGGTENADLLLVPKSNCFIAGDYNTSSVLWGSTNQNAFLIVTGGNGLEGGGSPFSGIASCTAGPRVDGHNTLVPASATLVASAINPHPSKTLILTNGTGKPFNSTNLTGSGPAFTSGAVQIDAAVVGPIVIDGVTYLPCANIGANAVPANNPLIGNGQPLGTNACFMTLTNSGTSCTTGSPLTGTLTIVGNDAPIIGGVQTTVGDTVPVTCE
jgi:hypothetical protein